MPDDKGKGIDELAVLAAVPKYVKVWAWALGPDGKLEKTADDEFTDRKIHKKARVACMTLDVCGEVAIHLRKIVESLGPAINAGMVPQIIAEHKDSARAIVAASTNLTAEFVGGMEVDLFLTLTGEVFEVNRDFFVRRVGPTAKALAEKMFGGVGLTFTSSSAATDAATQ